MLRPILCACLYLAALPAWAASPYAFPTAAIEDRATLDAAMPALARQLLADYRDDDRARYLNNRFRLQLVAGDYAEAERSLIEIRNAPPGPGPVPVRPNLIQYEIYAAAKAAQARAGGSFEAALAPAFKRTLDGVDAPTAGVAMRVLTVDPADAPRQRRALDEALAAQKGKTAIERDPALALVRAYQIERAYRELTPWLPALVAQDDQRRYLIERDIAVRTPDGATVCAVVVRQRAAPAKQPALLNFTIYADPNGTLNEARRSAANGYVGVTGTSRGKGCSTDTAVPYEHDGRDAAALIDWIAAQPWSDGRVGMYGGSYEGFTQWAAAKHRPKALKALMPSVTGAPGLDVPMEGGIFYGFQYYWPFYVTNNRHLDNAPLEDYARWNRMYRQWYVSGRAYNDLPKIDGAPNPTYLRWLSHPDYDAYWQDMIPYREEFADLDLKVLTTTGYYDGAQIGALYYVNQHYRYRPQAEHYLVIGPYNHVSGQRGTVATGDMLRGYRLDPQAQIDLGVLRYQWFDYVFKGAPKPALLADRINYQVMGADVWKHAPSLAAMGERRQRFHFGPATADGRYRFLAQSPGSEAFVTQTLDLRDRSDADRIVPGGGIVDRVIDTADSLTFVSEPFAQAEEFSGLFSGKLDLAVNKRDFDFNIGLYELTPQGDYFELSRYQSRASYVADVSHRQLLQPDSRTTLSFDAGRATSRRMQAGSRLVAVLSVLRNPQQEINYGSGKPVATETVADAGAPVQVQWYGDSYLEIPLSR
ncbi:CocE/NonD family hydrolase [Lysobacter sp. 5GHs7-4]|uniref:CocE/NonD family hydrolase n=1 Tax=Lysobacter sp. 5GHs7-4 TaxID=2904253 RepID=UPI001E45610F|nr:CocE/NonD family hydrolase [Lysobacter sp. 5GHs7-4]UHQ24875.1 CocE/NonD family hydrolase [Lysobacter sp. 5GHs7-4]